MRLAPGVISTLPDNSFRVANFAGEIKPRDSGQWGLGLRAHRQALGGEDLGTGEADALGGPGDENPLASQSEFHRRVLPLIRP